ncbi:MAG: flagellar motor switch protein FliN [Parvularculaceae bacterium]
MNALESAAPPLDIFADFSAAPTGASVTGELAPAGIRSVADVPVKISAVLGKKRMTVAELMKLTPGAVIELDRRVGEPIDLYVNDRLVARGELVLVDGALGVTMTEIVQSNDR